MKINVQLELFESDIQFFVTFMKADNIKKCLVYLFYSENNFCSRISKDLCDSKKLGCLTHFYRSKEHFKKLYKSRFITILTKDKNRRVGKEVVDISIHSGFVSIHELVPHEQVAQLSQTSHILPGRAR